MIWRQPFTLEGINQISKNTLFETLGMEFTEFGDDFITAKMPVDHRTRQPMGLLHGGASVALAETLGSVASLVCLENTQKLMPVGVEINANHLRPATDGFVYGTVRPIKVGRNIHVWSIEIKNEADKIVCVSRITIAIVPRS